MGPLLCKADENGGKPYHYNPLISICDGRTICSQQQQHLQSHSMLSKPMQQMS